MVHKELKKFSSVLTEINKHMVERIVHSKTEIKGDISNMLALPEFAEVEDVKKYLNVVSTKTIMDEVLEKVESNDVSVIIGSEHKELLLKDYTLVSLDVTDNTTNASLGIISPKRVDYSKTINTLKLVNEKLRKIFNKD
jgi:transcriptional regulator of heat shock response